MTKDRQTHTLITGASSGIGEALATHFHARGHRITIAARRAQRLHTIAQRLGPDGVFVRPTDLDDLDQCGHLIEDATRHFGPVDVLINNAGIQYVEPAAGVSIERAERLMRVDLLAPMRLIHHVLDAMIARESGHIVNISSMAGLIFTPGMCHYNAAKAGLAAASESLHVEVAPSGVHVLTVYPGPVRSEMEAAARDAFEPNPMVDKLPMGTPEELARLIDDALRKKRARIIYPSFYKASLLTRGMSQWMTNRFSPKLK